MNPGQWLHHPGNRPPSAPAGISAVGQVQTQRAPSKHRRKKL
jgi:hypothetical protein